MNISESSRELLRAAVREALASQNRINQLKPIRYWYPLSSASYGEEEILEALDSMCGFRTSMWEKTLLFERKFSSKFGFSDSVMVNSGSSADLLMAFLLTDPSNRRLPPGSEVLVPVVTWPTHVWSVLMTGLRVKFVDVDPNTLNICLDDLKSKISQTTKALFLVHLMGNPCNMDVVCDLAKKNDLILLEDCCEALGSTYAGRSVGTFGEAASFSFFFSHHITTMEGGMIGCRDGDTADKLRIFRAHGWTRNSAKRFSFDKAEIDERYAFVNWGFNVRPTDVNAGFGLRQLEKLDGFNTRRSLLFNKFKSIVLSSKLPIQFPKVDSLSSPSWLAIPMLLTDHTPGLRNRFRTYLEDYGVETRPIVAGNLARQPVGDLFPDIFKTEQFPGADLIHRNGLYIGLSPFTADSDLDKLIDTVISFNW